MRCSGECRDAPGGATELKEGKEKAGRIYRGLNWAWPYHNNRPISKSGMPSPHWPLQFARVEVPCLRGQMEGQDFFNG